MQATRKYRFVRRGGVVAGLLAASALAACGSSSESDAGGGKAKTGPYKIAFLSQGPTNGFATQFDAIAKKWAGGNKDVKSFEYFDSQGNADKQVTQFENALSQRPDGIVLVPMGKAALAGPVERAEAAGIPVTLCASGVDTEKYHTLVTRDIAEAGGENARWLAEQMGGKGNIVIVDGIAGNDTSESLGKAIRDVLKENPGIKVVGEGPADFSVSKAKSLTETFIASGKQIDGAWGSGGESVTGIMQAYADAGKPFPPIAGAAATNGALRLAKENDAKVAMFQFPATMSAGCLDTMVKTLKGEKLPKFIDITKLQSGLDNFHTEEIDKYYKPKFVDDYQTNSDQMLSEAELEKLNLVK